MKQIKWLLLLILGMSNMVHYVNAQSILTLSTTENIIADNTNYVKVGRDKVVIKAGVRYKPGTASKFVAKIDEKIVVPVVSVGTNAQTNRATINTELPVGTTDGKASVDEMGRAAYEIPIYMPPSIGNLLPSLSLNYSSTLTKGILGLGWSLSGISAIERSGNNLYFDNKVSGVKLDNTDKFTLDGQRLINLTSNYGDVGVTYGKELEDYTRVLSVGGTQGNPAWFKLEGLEGIVYEFGNDATAKTILNGATYKWYVNKVYDKNGNYIEFKYTNVNGEIAVDKILYTGNTLAGLLPKNEVAFYYDTKEDKSESYVNGSRIGQELLLRKIGIKVNGVEAKSYTLRYAFDIHSKLVEVVEKNGSSVLGNSTLINWGSSNYTIENSASSKELARSVGAPLQMIATGYLDNDATSDMIFYDPSTNFNNQPYFISVSSKSTVLNSTLIRLPVIPNLVKASSASFIDFDNDGMDEIYLFVKNGQNYNIIGYQYNSSTSNLIAVNNTITQYSVPVWNNDVSLQLLPVNYKGELDKLVVLIQRTFKNANDVNVQVIDGEVVSGSSVNVMSSFLQNQNSILTNLYTHRFVYTLDLNSDGKTDLLEIFQTANMNSERYTLVVYNYEEAENKFMPVSVQNEMLLSNINDLQVGDVNGDGNFDILTKISDNYGFYMGTGIGFSTSFKPLNELNAIINIEPNSVKFTDMNGDGYFDITYMVKVFDNTFNPIYLFDFYVFYSNGQTLEHKRISRLSRPSKPCKEGSNFFGNKESLNDPPVFFLLDYNGDGQKDIIYRKEITGGNTNYCYEADNIFFLHLSTIGADANRVVEVVNGFNNNVKFTYSSTLAARSQKGYRQTLRFDGNFGVLHRGVTQVAYLTHGIHNSQTVFEKQSFSYANGIYSTLGKGFLGYTQIETETEKTATAKSKTIRNKFLNTQFGLLSLSTVSTYVFKNGTYEQISSSSFNYTLNQVGAAIQHRYTIELNSVQDADLIKGMSYVKNYSNYNTLGLVGKIEEYYLGGSKKTTTEFTYTSVLSVLGNDKVLTKQVTIGPNGASATPYQGPVANNTTEFTYLPNGNVLSVKEHAEQPTFVLSAMEYTLSGEVKKKTVSSPNLPNQEERWVYDLNLVFPIEYYNQANQKTTFTYEPIYGNVLSKTTPDGFATRYEYSLFGALVKTTFSNGSEATFTKQWELAPLLPSITYLESSNVDDVSAVKTWYDSRGIKQLSASLNSSNEWVYEKFEYDALDRLIKQTKPYTLNQQESEKQVVFIEYDGLNRVRKMLDNGKEKIIDYSNGFDVPSSSALINTQEVQVLERTLQLNNASGKQYSYKLSQFNKDNELESVTDNVASIHYAYHANGNPLTITTDGATTTYQYDYMGNRQQITEPNTGTTLNTYNAYGQLLSEIDSRGFATGLVYNTIGQLTQKTITPPTGSGGSPIVTNYQYEVNGAAVNKPKSINGTDVQQTFTYDNKGRLSTYTEVVSGQTFNTSYQYNMLNNIVGVTYPSGFGVKYDYEKGRLKRIKRADDFSLIWEKESVNYLDVITNSLLGNGMNYEVTYNAYMQITSEKMRYQNQTPIYHHSYNFSYVNDDLIEHTDEINTLTEQFEYDVMDRLTKVTFTHTNPATEMINMQYQNNGNIKVKSDVSLSDYMYASSSPHAVTGIAGATVGALPSFSQQVVFNNANRPTQITYNTQMVAYTYADDNERRKAEYTNSAQVVKTKYYQANYEREIATDGSVKENHYIYASGKLVAIAIKQNGSTQMYYTATDHLGNINMLVTQNRAIAQHNSIDAWGRRRNTTNWTYTNVVVGTLTDRCYTGHEHLDDFGLINMNARLYDPYIGRMLSADNVLQDPTASQDYNKYSYVVNNPLKYTDPTGNEKIGGPTLQPRDLGHAEFYDNYMSFVEQVRSVQEEEKAQLRKLLQECIGGGAVNDGYLGGVDLSEYGGMSETFLSQYGMFRVLLKVAKNEIAIKEAAQKANNQAQQAGSGVVIVIQRTWETSNSTISTFSTSDGSVSGYIMEPAGPSTTESGLDKRIPAGTYNLTLHSGTIYKNVYKLYNSQVPQSRAILIHSGNKPSNTAGCLIPGSIRQTDYVGNSRNTLSKLNSYISAHINNGGVKIIILDPKRR